MPGVNLCLRALAQRDPGGEADLADVLWLTTGRAVEERVLAGIDEKLARISWERVVLALEPRGGGAPSRPALLWRTAPAVLRARRALSSRGSQVMLGLGGFTCLPAVLAARSLGLPVALLEMNAANGSATRWLAPFAKQVFHAWRGTMPTREESDSEHGASHTFVGPPLSPEFDGREISVAEEAGARSELGFDPDRPLLLVLGGSQGATALNRFVRTHAPALVGSGVQILHQTGPGKLEEGCEKFTGYRAVEYVAPVHRALCAATLVLSRGGASTLAEIAASGRPAVVVPYPHHPDRHQERNAHELGEGVRVVSEERLSVSLRVEIERLCSSGSRGERERMSRALRAAVPVDASARLLSSLLELARKKTTRRAGGSA